MPKVTEITVCTVRVIPHPHESYANLCPSLSIKVSIGEGEDIEAATVNLQGFAERLLALHIANIRANLEAEHQAELRRQKEEYERRKVERAARVPVAGMVEEEDEDEDEEEDLD